jgi:hypothetical protein
MSDFNPHVPEHHGRKLARRYSPDERDKKYPMRGQLPSEVAAVTKFWQVGPILDQGDTPQCVGYAGEQFLQTEPLMTMDGPSPQSLYDLAQANDEWPGTNYEGTSVRGLAKGMLTLGRLKSYVWAAGALDVRDWIILKGPAMLGSDWLMNMFWPGADGVLKVNGQLAGGHAYLVYGYDAATNMFKMANSWGTSWGLAGSAWIKYRDLDKLISRQGEACSAVEQLVTAS